MRQLIAIILLFLYLFTSTEISELLKLPQLAQHYKEHQQEQEEITFAAFLHQHYLLGEVNDADKKQDMKLPYKSIDFTNSICFTVLPSIISIEYLKTTDFEVLKPANSFYVNCFSSNNFSSIWQPPKLV